ncbi:MAG: imidazole glycerol phosphate synthase subunit HisH [Rhodospirillales bacterium]
MIAIVDIGVGNLGAIKNMLRKVGAEARITNDAADIRAAGKIILPGVGAFDQGMEALAASGLTGVLNEQALDVKKPVLGICLGAQMLGHSSEEGRRPGLGWIDMKAVRFPKSKGLRVPHMGWNQITPLDRNGKSHDLFADAEDNVRFYFAHSFYLTCNDPADVIATCDYGASFAAAVARHNIQGVQFHPEKSHRFGALVLRNFARVPE